MPYYMNTLLSCVVDKQLKWLWPENVWVHVFECMCVCMYVCVCVCVHK